MGAIRLYGSTSGYLELQAPAVAPDAVLTLPSDSVQPGLVHLHTETFSGVAGMQINNVFSPDYDNYRILLRATNASATSSQAVQLQFTTGGTPHTTMYYRAGFYVTATSTTPTGYYQPNQSSATIGDVSDYQSACVVDIFHPAVSGSYKHTMGHSVSPATTQAYYIQRDGWLINTSSFDGFYLSTSPGSMTGTLRIYGYRNS